MPPPDPFDGWNQQLLRDTERPEASMVFTPEEVAALERNSPAPRPDASVRPADQTLLLGHITRAVNSVSQVLDLINQVMHNDSADADATARAESEALILRNQYARQGSEALGAAAIRMARSLILQGRAADAQALLKNIADVQAAQALSEKSARSTIADDLLPVAGALALLIGAGYYWRSKRRR